MVKCAAHTYCTANVCGVRVAIFQAEVFRTGEGVKYLKTARYERRTIYSSIQWCMNELCS